jgi:DNA modification methylase
MFSVKGDTVLDPFLGSGTTVTLAMQNGRNSVGYETDESLVPLIKKKTASQSTEFKQEIIKRQS